MIILVVLILSIFSPFIIMSVIWYFWSKDKLRTEKLRQKEIIIKKKLNRIIWKEEAPFGEIRLPIMMLTVSSFVFIILTLGFGASINTQTGQPVWEIDWDQYFDDETGLYDPWVVSPMDQFMGKNKELVFATMYLGYCGILSVICIGWFQYMKWRWEHIPIEERVIHKPVYKDIEFERIKRKKKFRFF